jgi:tetratricopeptide (TPR) repeat protein
VREHREVSGSDALSRPAVLGIVATLLASPVLGQTQDRPSPPCSGSGRPPAVIAACSAFLADKSRSAAAVAEALRWRGKARYESKDADGAIADLSLALSFDPQDRTALSNRGSAYAMLGAFDMAFSDFRAVLSIDRDDFNSWLGLLSIYWQQKRYDLAIEAIDEAIRIQPQNGALYLKRGYVYRDKGDLDGAISDFDKAISVLPNYSYMLTDRCVLLSMVGRHTEGLASCEAAIAKWPDQAGGYFARGIVNLHMKRADDAIADFDKAIAIGSPAATTPASPLYGRGVAKRLKGDNAGGDADMAAAQAVDPLVVERMRKSGVKP